MWPPTQSLKRPENVCRDWEKTLKSAWYTVFCTVTASGSHTYREQWKSVRPVVPIKVKTLCSMKSKVGWAVKLVKAVWQTRRWNSVWDKGTSGDGMSSPERGDVGRSQSLAHHLLQTNQQTSLPGSWELHWPRVHWPLKIRKCQFAW